MKAQQITQFDRGQKAATDSLSVVLASDGDAAIARARVLPKFEPLTITDETVVIPTPALGTDQLYFTYVCVQNKVAESPCDILLQDALTANTPTKVWTIDAPVKGGGISEAYPANLGILWPPGKPLVIKPVPAQAVTVAIAYQTLDESYFPKSEGVVSAPYNAFTQTTEPAIVRFWGQSNTYGTVQNGTYPGPYPSRAKFIEDSSNTIKTIDASFSQNYGSLIYLALSLEAAYPNKDFVFVVTAQGGTGFNSGGGWNPGETQRTAWAAHNQQSLAILSTAYPGGWEEFGSIGIQGENDANGTVALANAYQAKVEALRTEIRSIVGATIPFYMVRLHIDANYPNTNIIRTAHQNVSDALINVDECELLPDQIHYSIAGYQCMAGKIEAVLEESTPISKDAIAAPATYSYSTDFSGADTADGTLADWVQYWQANGTAPGYFRRLNNEAVGTIKRYPRIMRPAANSFKNMWARMELPAQTWDGEPSFHLYLRYVHPEHSGYHLSVRPGRSTPSVRVGVNKASYSTDTFASQFPGFTEAYVPFSVPWDKAKAYVIQASAVTNGSATEIKGQGYEKATGTVLFDFTHTDNTATLLNASGSAGIGYFKQAGTSDAVIMRFDNFEMHELGAGDSMPAYTV